MTAIDLGGGFDIGSFDAGGFSVRSTPALVVGQGAISPGLSVPIAGLAMTGAAAALPFTFKQSLGGLQLTAGQGSAVATIPMSIGGFSLGFGLGVPPPPQTLKALVGFGLASAAGAVTDGITPNVDLSPTLDSIVVPYEDRTIQLLPEDTFLGIPAEEFVLYVSPDSRAEGETH